MFRNDYQRQEPALIATVKQQAIGFQRVVFAYLVGLRGSVAGTKDLRSLLVATKGLRASNGAIASDLWVQVGQCL